MERLINELHFINSPKAVDTIEVDIDSLPTGCYDYVDIIVETLRPLAESSPDLRATVYVQQVLSVNFGHSGSSIFIGVVGSPNALSVILNGFQSIPGVGARYGGSIFTNQSRRRLHIEDGFIWQQEDNVTWAVASSTESIEETADESVQYDEHHFERYPSQAKVYEAGDLLKKQPKLMALKSTMSLTLRTLLPHTLKAFIPELERLEQTQEWDRFGQ